MCYKHQPICIYVINTNHLYICVINTNPSIYMCYKHQPICICVINTNPFVYMCYKHQPIYIYVL